MRVRTKFAVVLVVIMLVLSGVVLASLEVLRQQAVDEASRELDETSELTAEQIDASIRERADFVGFVASRPASRKFDRSEETLGELTSTRFYAAQLIHRNGTVLDFRGEIDESVRQETVGNETDATYARAALDGRVHVNQTEWADGRPFVVISAPIRYENGTMKGALAGAIWVTNRTFLQSTRPLERESQTVTVAAADGEPLKGAEREFDASLNATATVETTGWRVTVERDRAGLTGRLQQLALVQGMSLVVVLATIVSFGVWEYRTNVRQAERLLAGFGALRRGEYDYSLSLSAGEEWRQIGEGFTDLASGLRAREAALREQGQRLEVLNRVLRHNLRNEMSVVLNYADIIRDFTDDGQIEQAADTILETSRTLTALSDKARQVRSAFEDADRYVTFEAADLVSGAVATVADDYPDVDVRTSVPDGVAVVGIPSLGAAVENLLENACEHNDAADPTVDVSVEVDDVAAVDLEEPASFEFADRGDAAADGSGEAVSESGGDSPGAVDGSTSDGSAAGGAAAATGADAAGEREAAGTPPDPTGVVRLAVADNGPGIPDHEYEVLTKGEETALEHGSGLGLWLVFWVVEKSGGELTFGENEPRGAVVTMELPAVIDREADPAGPDSTSNE